MSVYSFIKSRSFFRTILIMLVVSLLLAWGVVQLLSVYTRHNSELEMPDVRGYQPEELSSNPSFTRYEYVIIDSVYETTRPKGSILTQDPFPGSMVKKGRKVYLTVVAITPEQVSMPDLSDLTLRQARSVLETYGLKIGVLSYVPDIGKTVIRQMLGNTPIDPGTLVEKGKRINLVLGEGTDNERITAPLLVGLSYEDAMAALQLAGFNVGEEVFMDGNDSKDARVFRQQPLPNYQTGKGTKINLWYRSSKRFDFENYLKTYTKDSLYTEPEIEE
jgi:eukaryotic-like serine/threonine-protein kinase